MTLSFCLFLALCAFVVCVVVALGWDGTIFDHFPDAGKMVNPFGAGGKKTWVAPEPPILEYRPHGGRRTTRTNSTRCREILQRIVERRK